jgi:diguanylate cyclase (GGDEF)-like protein
MPERKLLVLDDDPLIGQTITSIAVFCGFNTELCTTPERFFELFFSWNPDVIALDLIMPKMDGVEVLAELGKLRCRAGIIITSGVGSRVLDAASRSAQDKGLNIVGTLAKPFSPKMFCSLLGRCPKIGNKTKSFTVQEVEVRHFELADLQQALKDRQFRLAYQPKVDCQSGLISGFEALSRLEMPQQGNIPPDTFIPLAEQHDLIDVLTEQVLTSALQWLKKLPEQVYQRGALPGAVTKLNELTVSVNISARSLGNRTLFDNLVTECAQAGIPPNRIILELTETSTMEEPSFSLDILTRLRMQGFKLSIDDFGTGFSSMVQLVRLPFSEIKIDKSFVMTVPISEESRAVTRSIAELGQSLNLQVTAEGVEDQQTLDFLNSIGCQQAQGFFISRAIESSEVADWIVHYLQQWDKGRLNVLKKLNLLDTAEDEEFDRHTRLAKRLFNVPIALVCLVDEERQWFKSHQGLDIRQTSRASSFCTHTILCSKPLVIEDAQRDDRFAGNELVTGASDIRFYAGTPLRAGDGTHIGTLCILDTQPRQLTDDKQQLLQDIGLLVEKEIDTNVRATQDYLTGFSGRAGFEIQAQESLELCCKLRLPVSLMLLDLDNFGKINHEFGHAEGDKVLQSFAGLLRNVVRESDLVARFGADEFAILLIDAGGEQLNEVVGRLRYQLAEFNQHHNNSYELDFSSGEASTDSLGKVGFSVLLETAKDALERAKRQK